MAKSCEFRTSEASSKSWLRTKGIIDQYLNIKDLNSFRKAVLDLTALAKKDYNVDKGRLFGEVNQGTKATVNYKAFHLIDAKKGIFYPENKYLIGSDELFQLESSELEGPLKELDDKIRIFLSNLGVRVEAVDRIFDKDGNPVDAVGKADLVKKIIQVANGEAKIDTLSEEAAHFFVEALAENDPTLKSMMDKIESYSIYQEVVDEYSDIYGDNVEALKKEAIGKLIAKRIIYKQKLSDSPSKVERFDSWFKVLWSKIKKLFLNTNTSSINNFLDEFDQAADKIMKGDVEGLKTAEEIRTPVTEEMYQLKKGKSRDEIVSAIEETQTTILEPTYLTEEDSRYRKATGEKVAGRVTDKQTEKFERSVGKDKAKFINESPENIIKRDTGIAMHKIAEGLMSHLVNGTAKPGLSVKIKGKDKTVTLPQAIYDKIEEQVKALHAQITDTQNSIDPNQKATIKLENRVYSEQEDLAGSIDVLAIYSDGRASVFDYKFLNLDEKDGKISDFAKQKLFYKEDSYGLQMSEYKRILRDTYGIKGFIHTRVVPMNVRFAWDKKAGKMTDRVMALNTTLDQIPLANELTQDERLNELLEKLFAVKSNLLKDLKTAKNPDVVRVRLRNVSDSIKEIQLRQNISYVINEITSLSNNIHSRKNIEDPANKDYLTTEELVEYNNYFKVYANIVEYTRTALANLKKTDKEEYQKVEDALTLAVVHAQIARDTIYNKIKDRIAEKAEGSGIKNPLAPQVEGASTFGSILRYLSEWNHPAFKMLWKFVKEKQDNTRNRTNEIVTKLEEKTEALKAWGKSKGLSGVRIYDLIINPETGNLVRKFSSEFRTEQEAQRSKKNIKWFKENFIQTAEDKAKFEEAKKKQFEYYDKMFAYKGADFIAGLKQNWINTHDLTNDDAWLNKYSYKTLKDPTKWESEEYKTLKQAGNEAALDYYNFYTETNKELSKILPVKISANFVANIHKDMIDAIGENGIDGIAGMGKGLMQSMEVREEDKAFSIIDEVTGELKFQIPVLYLNPIRDKEGRIDTSAKSRDLSKSLTLFTQMAYNYKYSNEMRDDILSLRELLVNEKQIITDKQGRIVIDPITQKPLKGVGNKLNLEAFDKFVNYYFGGKKVQSKDSIVNINGYDISRDKIILNIMNWFSVKSLAFNPVSIFANAVGARANLYFAAMKEAYFTKEQMRSTYKLFASQDPKYLASANYFDISQEDLTMKKANKLSTSTLGKLLNNETFYIGQRKAEEAVDRNLTVAMMQNYGLAPDGKVKKLSQLPKNTKSLWELASFDEKTGYKVEGMSEQQYNDFRRKVQYVSTTIKGNNSNEDIALYKTSMVGLLLGQFRGWMPRMIKERFGETRFNQDMEQVEMGRFRVIFGEFVSNGITQNLQLLLNDVSVLDYKQNEKAAKLKYEEYLNKNNLTEEELPFEEFLEVRRGQLKAAAAELRMYLMVVAAIALLGGDWDDDNKADYKKYWATRKLVQIANRTQLELGFFFNPSEATTLVRSPLPISGVLIDIQKFISNTLDETRDVIMGENETRDQSPIFYNITKFVPLVKPTADFFEVFRDSGDDYDFTTKEGDHNPQFEIRGGSRRE